MSLNRRGFIKTAPARWPRQQLRLLAQAKIDSSKSIKVANLLDKTGVLNNYCLKQIKAVAMAADEITPPAACSAARWKSSSMTRNPAIGSTRNTRPRPSCATRSM